MRIAVPADTHVSKLGHLPKEIIAAISTVDLMIHAGDFTDLQLLNGLKQLSQVKAVHGNMDSSQLESVLPAKEIVEASNKRTGITHGSGGSWEIEQRVKKVLETDRIDIIVCGHSHRSQNKIIDRILFFNPGKAADCFGIITIDGQIKAETMSSR